MWCQSDLHTIPPARRGSLRISLIRTSRVRNTEAAAARRDPGDHDPVSRRSAPRQDRSLASASIKTSRAARPCSRASSAPRKRSSRSRTSKTYVAIAGNAGFNRGVEELLYGKDHPALKAGRVSHRADARRQRRLEHRRPSRRAREAGRAHLRQRSDVAEPSAAAEGRGLAARHVSVLRLREAPRRLRADAGAAREGERRRARADSRLLPQPVRCGPLEGAVASAHAALRAARPRAVHRHRVPGPCRRPRRGRVRRAAHGRALARGRRRHVVLEELGALPRARRRRERRLGERRSGEARGRERGERRARHLLDAARSRRRDRRQHPGTTRRCARSGSRSSRRCAAG